MPKFRKKPVVIEAVQVTAADFNPGAQTAEDLFDGSPFSDMPDWLASALEVGAISVCDTEGPTDYAVWKMTTVHGETAIARPGDWIIPDGEPGTFYPCKPGIFAATYEPADEPAVPMDSAWQPDAA